MGTTNILDMNNRISDLEKDVTSVGGAVDELKSGLTNLHIWAYNVEQYGKYMNNQGTYTNYDLYCVVKIPVRGGLTYIVENASQNVDVYTKFLDVSGNQLGDIIRQAIAPLRLEVPAGAVSVLVTMSVNSGYPKVSLVTN